MAYRSRHRGIGNRGRQVQTYYAKRRGEAKSYFAALFSRHGILQSALLNVLLFLLLMQATRWIFYGFNRNLFPGIPTSGLLQIALGGVRFDLAVGCYALSLYLLLAFLPFSVRYKGWYRGLLKGVYVVSAGLSLACNCADTIYYRFTSARSSFDVFREFQHERKIGGLLLGYVVEYWYMTVIFAVLVLLLVWLYRGYRAFCVPPGWRWGLWRFLLNTVLLLGVSTGAVLAIRGGWMRQMPMGVSDALLYVERQHDAALVLNTPYVAIRNVAHREPIEKLDYFSSEGALEEVFTPVHVPQDTARRPRRNVVIIILESFGREYIGAYNQDDAPEGYCGYTPFLDSLIGESRWFRYSLANGYKSIDAIPAIMLSLPRVGLSYVISRYSSNDTKGLPALLEELGYTTAYFHGGPNSTMGFNSIAKSVGFTYYYGMEAYGRPEDYDGHWGIWDEPFLQYFARTMGEFKQPFCTAIHTVTSHAPYVVPEQYADSFPEGPLPIHRCVGYTDFALRRFFQTVRQQPWFDSTLFVITADHTNLKYYPGYENTQGRHAVPIVFYCPSDSLRGRCDQVASHIDIMPTVLAYVGYNRPYLAFGRDLFDTLTPARTYIADNEENDVYWDSLLLVSHLEKPLQLFSYQRDRLLQHDLLSQASHARADSMQRYANAVRQQYQNRLLDNHFTVDSRDTAYVQTYRRVHSVRHTDGALPVP